MNRDALLKSFSKNEDKLLIARILDKYLLYEKSKSITHSDFLDPYQRNIVNKALDTVYITDYRFYGGFDGAERAIAVFCPNDMQKNNYWELNNLIRFIKVELKTRDNYSHRDYLGALMGLGIKREKVGDILVKEDFCILTVMEEISDYVLYNLTKVGNAKASVRTIEANELDEVESKVVEINRTVASLRLDSVAGAGFSVSRGKIADLIRAEKVSLNWEITPVLTKQVKEGDTISIRGKGRVVLEKIGNNTKKDRIHVILKKYV